MAEDLSEEERAALVELLREMIGASRYFLSLRINGLKGRLGEDCGADRSDCKGAAAWA